MPIEDLAERPVYSVRSGPALAPVAGRAYAGAELDEEDVVVCDTGGTSFDVSLIRGGEVVTTRETWLGEPYSGHLTGLSSVDVRSIGAGGGSIAWVDSGGLLRVGPESAGADPGPGVLRARRRAADGHRRGRGARLPRPGALPRRRDAARPRRGRGRRSRPSPGSARARGGGAGGDHGRQRAHGRGDQGDHDQPGRRSARGGDGRRRRRRGAGDRGDRPRARLPPGAAAAKRGALSAFGGQQADIVSEAGRSLFTDSASFAFDEVGAALDAVDESLAGVGAALAERGVSEARIEHFVEARYAHQVWDLEIPLERERIATPADLERAGRELSPHPQARVRGRGAGPAGRDDLLEGPPGRRAGEAAARRARPGGRTPSRAGSAERTAFFPGAGGGPRPRSTRAARCRPATGSPARR